MYSSQALQRAMEGTLCAVNFRGGVDTFAFRKAFERELGEGEKAEILEYIKQRIPLGGTTYQTVKSQIDTQEFLTTDYYQSPYPRKFLGAYAPVVYKTLGGIMRMFL